MFVGTLRKDLHEKRCYYSLLLLIVVNIFFNSTYKKFNIYEKDWSKFDEENFTINYFSIDWDKTLKIKEQNIDYYAEYFKIKSMNCQIILQSLKKPNKCKLKFKSKPWIKLGLQKPDSVKNKFLSDFIKKKFYY